MLINGDDMKLFLIVFSLALIFVVGTAGIMRYFDSKAMKRKSRDENQ